MKNKKLSARDCARPSEAVQPQHSPPSSGSRQSFIRIIQTEFPRVSPSYSRSSIANTLVSVERITEPRSKLSRKDRIDVKVGSAVNAAKPSPQAFQLLRDSQHLTIRKRRELWKQRPAEAQEISKLEREIFEQSRPFRVEYIWTEEQYEELYQSRKEEIIEEVVNGDVDLLLFYLKFYGPRLLAEPRILSLVQEWWLTKRKSRKAHNTLQRVFAVLLESLGRPEKLTEAEKRQQARERKRLFDDRMRATREKLTQTISAAARKLPTEVTRDPQHREAAIEKIADEVLNPYLNRRKGYEREAAKKLKHKINQRLSRGKR